MQRDILANAEIEEQAFRFAFLGDQPDAVIASVTWMADPDLAPLNEDASAARDKVWFLHMEVSATSDWVCAVQCNGRELFRDVIGNRGSWRAINLMLPSNPTHPEYELKIFNHAGGVHAWHDECGYFSNVRVYSPD